ncbi:MAG: serine/threonine-protein phosphatase [Pyrinomonadaceae bacterium]|nr:serine/threonine-protein phosphatase [Pyrinomonadaceae bacterium]
MIKKPSLRFVSAAITDKGLSDKRPVNEDSYLEMIERGLFAVADGVGGAQAGDFASQTAMEVLYEAFSHPQPNVDTEELMEMAIDRANESIFRMSRELPQLDMMATTIVTLHLQGNIATIGHVGDSRLYRLDTRGNLFRETQDHSVVEEEVRAGRMTMAQAINHPSRNVISRALGADETVEIDMKTIMFEPDSIFLLCSDGITRHLDDKELREILLKNKSPIDACREMKTVCYERGAEDNLTAVIIRAEEATGISMDDDGDEERTLAGARPSFQPVSIPNFNNGANNPASETKPNDFGSKVNRREELPTTETPTIQQPNAPSIPTASTLLTPTSQLSGANGESLNTDTTFPANSDGDRSRTRVQSGANSDDYSTIEPQKSGGSVGKLLSSLALILLGAILGFGGYYGYNQMTNENPVVETKPTQTVVPTPQMPAFVDFEKQRRDVDADPNLLGTSQKSTAKDKYLQARGFMKLKEYEKARVSLTEAEKLLETNTDSDIETLRVDIALASAAVNTIPVSATTRRTFENTLNPIESSPAQQPPSR